MDRIKFKARIDMIGVNSFVFLPDRVLQGTNRSKDKKVMVQSPGKEGM
jgi:hypothetical protein